jgi:V/A-type H+/Na+-transporting ATPase subunit E
MPDLEKADSRIQVICDKIRSETLDPAKEQAQEIIENARREAERIMHNAHSDAEQLIKQTKKSLSEEKQIFDSSLEQAAKQSVELLKQKVETSFFNPKLEEWVKDQLGDEKNYATLVQALVKAIDKDGIKTELSVKIPQAFKAETINAQLSQDILKQLKNNSVELSDIAGGVQVKILGKNMVLDISSKALEEIIASFIHKDFRKVFFGAN